MRRDPYYQERAKELRRNENHAERLLWSRLRAHQMDGRKFRRQHAIGSYIVDFVCLQARLVIEVDGETHTEDERQTPDAQRTAYLEKLGFRVLRFWNHSIYENLDGVAGAIYDELQGERRSANLDPSPQPSPLQGEGDALKFRSR
jgi:very-short-patch-repair endonuclease